MFGKVFFKLLKMKFVNSFATWPRWMKPSPSSNGWILTTGFFPMLTRLIWTHPIIWTRLSLTWKNVWCRNLWTGTGKAPVFKAIPFYTKKCITVGIRIPDIQISEPFKLQTFTSRLTKWSVIQTPSSICLVQYSVPFTIQSMDQMMVWLYFTFQILD